MSGFRRWCPRCDATSRVNAIECEQCGFRLIPREKAEPKPHRVAPPRTAAEPLGEGEPPGRDGASTSSLAGLSAATRAPVAAGASPSPSGRRSKRCVYCGVPCSGTACWLHEDLAEIERELVGDPYT